MREGVRGRGEEGVREGSEGGMKCCRGKVMPPITPTQPSKL